MLSNQCLITLPEVRTKGLVPKVRHTCLRLSVKKVEGHVGLTPPVDIQLSTSSSPAASYPEAPSSVSDTLIGIVTGNEQDQNPRNGGRLSLESESDSDCESRVGMEGEGEGGLVCGGGIGPGDKH